VASKAETAKTERGDHLKTTERQTRHRTQPRRDEPANAVRTSVGVPVLGPVLDTARRVAVAVAAVGGAWMAARWRGLRGRPGHAHERPETVAEPRDPAAEIAAWQAVVDALPGAAIAVDATGAVAYHNAAAEELYPRVKRGQPISHVSRNPAFMGAVERIGTAAEPITVELIERVPVERRFFATLARLTPAVPVASLPHVLITFRDHSEQDKLVQMRADFIANASHELRTPLASLRGFVETLQGPARFDPEARDRFLGIMATQAARMTRLIDDLLSLSRAEMRVHLPPRGVVELNETCAAVMQTLEPLAAGARVNVTFHKLPGPALVRGERDELLQVFQNLVQNAIKYGRTGGNVAIRLTREAPVGNSGRDRLVVAIEDDGPGIAPEHLPRLTERFYRVNAASSREKGGTGLGLAIVKHIVNRHRGELVIQSRVGVGSTFAVTFDALGQELSPAPEQNKKNDAESVDKVVTK
jgi:two-component system phosphate regulon sensor histidine kinase PhoR